ncbi:MAG: hypothetical protein HW397_211 [Dehalococcoidia bacterium]|nr:hypothetical protein [Dehalococcoidia bacterium]
MCAVAAAPWLLGRPVSEYGGLCQGAGGHEGGGRCRKAASLPREDSLIPPVTRIAGHLKSLSVSILCQDHEVLDGTMGQTDLDVEAAKLLNRLTMWPMVTVGAWPAENSKTFGSEGLPTR